MSPEGMPKPILYSSVSPRLLQSSSELGINVQDPVTSINPVFPLKYEGRIRATGNVQQSRIINMLYIKYTWVFLNLPLWANFYTHFPTELKQCGKFDQRNDTCFLKAKRVYKKTSLTVKSNNSVFWSYFVSKLRNFETRFQARDTWVPVDSPWVEDGFRQWNFSICSNRTGVTVIFVKGCK